MDLVQEQVIDVPLEEVGGHILNELLDEVQPCDPVAVLQQENKQLGESIEALEYRIVALEGHVDTLKRYLYIGVQEDFLGPSSQIRSQIPAPMDIPGPSRVPIDIPVEKLGVKRKFCKDVQSAGGCQRGLYCKFAHHHSEIGTPVVPDRRCYHYLAGRVCPFGQNCKFLHER